MIRGYTVLFVAIVAFFHLMRADLDPLTRGISRYQFGPRGYLMGMAFVLLGGALLAVAAAVRLGRFARPAAMWLFAVAGLASVVVAFVPLPDHPAAIPNAVHQIAGGLLWAGAVGGMLLTSRGLKAKGATMTARAGVIALALFTLAGLRAAPLVPVLGLLQRVAAATICVWLLAFTARLTSDL